MEWFFIRFENRCEEQTKWSFKMKIRAAINGPVRSITVTQKQLVTGQTFIYLKISPKYLPKLLSCNIEKYNEL